MNRTFLALGLTLLAGVAMPSHADVLCTTRSGALRARPACKRREKAVDLATLGPVGIPGPPGETGAPGPTVQLVDAAGRSLSSKLIGGEGLAAIFKIGNVVVVAAVVAGGFPSYVRLSYEMSDCAGPPFIDTFGTLVRSARVAGSTAYYPGDPLETRVFASLADTTPQTDCMTSGGTFRNGFCCFNGSPQMRFSGPAVILDVSELGARFPATAVTFP